jgi:prepilin-type N-terminal cleavage/methylation domain-containing protein/prepilin-type processing-associated H-X9-DG protein
MSTKADRPFEFRSATRAAAFTLIELLVVITVIAVLAGILLPTLARSKMRAQATFCLNNTKQLTLAWIMYADDHDGRLAYNVGLTNSFGFGSGAAGSVGVSGMAMNWANNLLNWEVVDSDNTNVAKLTASGLGPYVGQAAITYRCPSDHVLSRIQRQAGWIGRVRSYSMNAMVGDAGAFSKNGYNENNPDYLQFFKFSTIPRPSDIFVFLDEHPDSISDGYFVNRAYDPEWIRLPASYHDRGAGFSFADGHSEVHHWQYASTAPPSLPFQARTPIQVPSTEREDFDWVISRMSVEQGSDPDAGPTE